MFGPKNVAINDKEFFFQILEKSKTVLKSPETYLSISEKATLYIYIYNPV
jgi:hypothetical protein